MSTENRDNKILKPFKTIQRVKMRLSRIQLEKVAPIRCFFDAQKVHWNGPTDSFYIYFVLTSSKI